MARPKYVDKIKRKQICTDDDAKEIYKIYPRKVAPLDAIRSIKKAFQLLCKAKRGEMADGKEVLKYLTVRVQAFANSEQGKQGSRSTTQADGTFIPPTPHPATWFNRGSYDDDEAEWNPTRRPSHKVGPKIHVAAPRDKTADEYEHAKRVRAAMKPEILAAHIEAIHKAVPATRGGDDDKKPMTMLIAERVKHIRTRRSQT